MGGKQTEACGRCAMSSVVEAAGDGDGSENPFDGARIEVDESQLRTLSPSAWLSGLKTRIDTVATELTYGRR
jgi:hypothetical protein